MKNMLGERHLVHCKTTAVEEKDVFEGWNRNTHTKKKSKLRQKITTVVKYKQICSKLLSTRHF